jgi:putative hydrolase of the HAD superfamily
MEKAYYSHEMGLRKPNQRIYERVLKKSRLDPYETVFVDDSEPNVIAAENLGMRGVLVTPGADLAALLRQHDIQ